MQCNQIKFFCSCFCFCSSSSSIFFFHLFLLFFSAKSQVWGIYARIMDFEVNFKWEKGFCNVKWKTIILILVLATDNWHWHMQQICRAQTVFVFGWKIHILNWNFEKEVKQENIGQNAHSNEELTEELKSEWNVPRLGQQT